MISDKQHADWKACVEMASANGWLATANSLQGDGPDNITDFAGLLENWRKDDKRTKE